MKNHTSKLIIKRIKSLLCHVALIIVSIVFLFPIFYIITTSLKPDKLVSASPPVWFAQPSLQNFILALFRYDVGQALIVSLIIAVFSTVIGLLLAAPSAYAIERFEKKNYAFLILVSTMIPYVAFAIPLFLMFRTIGWFDTYQGLITSHLLITAPQSVWILRGFIQGIPKELEEAALIDGSTKFGVFSKIIIPLIKPGFAAAGILNFVLSWNNFSMALMLAGAKVIPAPLALFNFVGEASINWGGLTASGTLMIIPSIIFTIFIQKYLKHGFIAGSIR